MLVKCTSCGFAFEITPDEIKYSIGVGEKIPFVSCRNPDTYYLYGREKPRCNEFIDLRPYLSADNFNRQTSEENGSSAEKSSV